MCPLSDFMLESRSEVGSISPSSISKASLGCVNKLASPLGFPCRVLTSTMPLHLLCLIDTTVLEFHMASSWIHFDTLASQDYPRIFFAFLSLVALFQSKKLTFVGSKCQKDTLRKWCHILTKWWCNSYKKGQNAADKCIIYNSSVNKIAIKNQEIGALKKCNNLAYIILNGIYVRKYIL